MYIMILLYLKNKCTFRCVLDSMSHGTSASQSDHVRRLIAVSSFKFLVSWYLIAKPQEMYESLSLPPATV